VNKHLIVSESEKQKLTSLVDANQNFAETVTELLMYYDQLVHELKDTNPALSLRIMNKVSDIMQRRILT
jgi:hypothetical protein